MSEGEKKKPPKGSDEESSGDEADVTLTPDHPKFYAKASIDAVLDHLECTRNGLTQAEVEERLLKYGKNQLEEHHVHPLIQFLLFYWNPLSWTMELAAFLAIILGDYVDFILIFGLLTVNATIGFYEEHTAGNAMAALKNQLAPTATCLRDGEWQKSTSAFELVPGDIIRLTLGNVVPADVKVLEADKGSASMKIDQSSLTGESLPVTKYPGSELFAGSTVKMGEMDAVVYATGVNTFFGKAANLVATTETHGHFQDVLKNIGLFCICFIAVCVALELIIQFPARQKSCTGLSWQPGKDCTTMDNILVLIVGGIPIAMPTVLSVTMALGAAKLAEHQAIVARLTAVEEMAGMDVLCSDKTGTLTLNKLRVDTPVLADDNLDIDPEVVHLHAALAAVQVNPDAIDYAMVESMGEKKKMLTDEYEQLKFTPFDPVSKKSQAVIKRKADGKLFKVAKGAPQVMLNHVVNKADVEEKVHGIILEFAERGFRSLGVAYCDDPKYLEGEGEETTWIYEGVVPMFDPPRIDTKEVIEKVRNYGIMVKMITGDQMAIARETCKQLGMGKDPMNPNILTPDHLDEAEKEGNPHLVETADGFAQVFPEHKYAIVAGLQKLNHVVGMTGDGVNDAPALKKADIGIAVADATDAARAASDIVLVSPGLSVIVEAIFGSRKIFQRMRNYVLYSVSATVRVCITFTLLTLIFDFYFPTIVIAIMALLNDGTILTISKDRVKASKNPDHWYLPRVFLFAMVLGGLMVIETFTLFLVVYLSSWPQDWFTMNSLDDAQLRGLIYINLSVSGQATIFVTRTEGWWFLSRPSILLLGAFVVAQVVATLIGLYGFNDYPNDGDSDFAGCGWSYALLAWIWTGFFFLLKDPAKFLFYRVIDLFVRAHPVRRTKKVFGHPVYGRHGTKALHFGSMWPQMTMEPPSPEDVAEVAAGLRRASLDLVENPWKEGGDIPLKKKHKKHKKHRKDPARSALVAEHSSDEEGGFKHHHHQHHHKDSDSDEYGSDLSFEEYSDEEGAAKHKKSEKK